MSLKKYQEKRDFQKTTEPEGKLSSNKGKVYVIQRHDASHLHYDLRLEKDGVLKSWAIPKDPPLKKGVKRLAIHVEDHPLDYADFEGTIPEGEYGAGTVEIWDKGVYEAEKWKEDEIIIQIDGDRLDGRYCLIKFRPKEDNWLFFRCGE